MKGAQRHGAAAAIRQAKRVAIANFAALSRNSYAKMTRQRNKISHCGKLKLFALSCASGRA
jgi:hypothetical protein